MKKFLAVMLGTMLVFVFVGVSIAAPFTVEKYGLWWFDNGGLTSKTWTFDIPGGQVNSATLLVGVYDDEPFDLFGKEYANLLADGTQLWNGKEIGIGLYDYGVLSQALDNSLSVTITKGSGDFGIAYVGVKGDAAAPVPEPASMLLFGTGTIVFGGYLRRRYKKV